jgi:hypothetical protein
MPHQKQCKRSSSSYKRKNFRCKKKSSSCNYKKCSSDFKKNCSSECEKVNTCDDVKVNVYASGVAQVIPVGVDTIVRFNTVLFDTNNSFIISNSQFQPQVAGYYDVDAVITYLSAGTQSPITLFIRKNGIQKIASNYFTDSTVVPAVTQFTEEVETLVYMNGTTDYLEVLINASATALTLVPGQDTIYFTAFLAK